MKFLPYESESTMSNVERDIFHSLRLSVSHFSKRLVPQIFYYTIHFSSDILSTKFILKLFHIFQVSLFKLQEIKFHLEYKNHFSSRTSLNRHLLKYIQNQLSLNWFQLSAALFSKNLCCILSGPNSFQAKMNVMRKALKLFKIPILETQLASFF